MLIGSNEYGQLGDGTTEDHNIPTRNGTGTGWTAVAAGRCHTVALKEDGSLWSWGWTFVGGLIEGNNMAFVTRT